MLALIFDNEGAGFFSNVVLVWYTTSIKRYRSNSTILNIRSNISIRFEMELQVFHYIIMDFRIPMGQVIAKGLTYRDIKSFLIKMPLQIHTK